MRHTEIISTWPIGYPGISLYEGPICNNNKVSILINIHLVIQSLVIIILFNVRLFLGFVLGNAKDVCFRWTRLHSLLIYKLLLIIILFFQNCPEMDFWSRTF